MRGLKHKRITAVFGRNLSHLLQMRGLKLIDEDKRLKDDKVASFTDAWIETESPVGKSYVRPVASFTDAWIETELLRTETVYP